MIYFEGQEITHRFVSHFQDIAAWIQEDIDDFSQTILSNLQRVDWKKIGNAALFSFLRGALDQLVLVRLVQRHSSIFAIKG